MQMFSMQKDFVCVWRLSWMGSLICIKSMAAFLILGYAPQWRFSCGRIDLA